MTNLLSHCSSRDIQVFSIDSSCAGVVATQTAAPFNLEDFRSLYMCVLPLKMAEAFLDTAINIYSSQMRSESRRFDRRIFSR